jgi:hypothetical protein
MSYLEDRLNRKNGLAPRLPTRKEKKPLRKVSPQRAKEMAMEKERLGGDDTMKEKWFQARRKEMIGTCQCGCGQPSQKKDDMYFRHSAAHIFPQRLFPSIQFHKLNWVERRFWGGCHSVMDDTSMDKWPNFADFDDIKEKFHALSPLLTDTERKTKFYRHLERLIYENP